MRSGQSGGKKRWYGFNRMRRSSYGLLKQYAAAGQAIQKRGGLQRITIAA